MGENIADLAGLLIPYDAYHTALGTELAPVPDGYSSDQRFFLGFAQIWRRKSRDEAMRKQVTTDPHSPKQFHIDGVVRNVDAWYAAFGINPDQKLYLAPDQRERIW